MSFPSPRFSEDQSGCSLGQHRLEVMAALGFLHSQEHEVAAGWAGPDVEVPLCTEPASDLVGNFEREQLVMAFRSKIQKDVDIMHREELMSHARRVLGVQVRHRSRVGTKSRLRSVRDVRRDCKAIAAKFFYLGDLGSEDVDAMSWPEVMEYARSILGVHVRQTRSLSKKNTFLSVHDVRRLCKNLQARNAQLGLGVHCGWVISAGFDILGLVAVKWKRVSGISVGLWKSF